MGLASFHQQRQQEYVAFAERTAREHRIAMLVAAKHLGVERIQSQMQVIAGLERCFTSSRSAFYARAPGLLIISVTLVSAGFFSDAGAFADAAR